MDAWTFAIPDWGKMQFYQLKQHILVNYIRQECVNPPLCHHLHPSSPSLGLDLLVFPNETFKLVWWCFAHHFRGPWIFSYFRIFKHLRLNFGPFQTPKWFQDGRCGREVALVECESTWDIDEEILDMVVPKTYHTIMHTTKNRNSPKQAIKGQIFWSNYQWKSWQKSQGSKLLKKPANMASKKAPPRATATGPYECMKKGSMNCEWKGAEKSLRKWRETKPMGAEIRWEEILLKSLQKMGWNSLWKQPCWKPHPPIHHQVAREKLVKVTLKSTRMACWKSTRKRSWNSTSMTLVKIAKNGWKPTMLASYDLLQKKWVIRLRT